MRILSSIILLLCLSCAALAQDTDRALAGASANGVGLPTRTNVNESVNAQAVLIPMHDARRIFGKEIGERYAVIEVNVGNKSPDAALIIHGIFVDYSQWPLSGTPPPDGAAAEAEARDEPFIRFQSSTRPSQIASEEYRIVRGQFLNAQTWRKRSWVMRLLTLASNVAGAYTFSINEQGFIKGIAAFNGVVVPGIDTAWPDTSLDQLNRINDFGFQTNKVVPKESAEVIVCFFPIDRFLTPGFARLFRKAPSLFFAPLQMIVDEDKNLRKEVDRALGEDLGLKLHMVNALPGETVREALRRQLPCYLHIVKGMTRPGMLEDTSILGQIQRSAGMKCLEGFGITRNPETGEFTVQNVERFKSFAVLDYVGGVSLNKVTVTIDGSMNLDISAIAPRIDSVTFDEVAGCGGADAECFWSAATGGGTRTGTISGTFLSGGSVAIAEAKGLKIEDVKAVAEGSGEKALRFSFKLKQGVPTSKALTFRVTKPKPGSTTTLDSNPFAIPVRFSPGTPTLAGVELKDNKVTVTGAGFVDAPAPNALTVKLMAPDDTVTTVTNATIENDKMVIPLPANPTPGCWRVIVRAGTRDATQIHDGRFAVVPTPTLTAAKIQGDKIVLSGTNLVDTEACGGKSLGFRLANADEAGKFLELTPKSPTSRTGGEFNLPEEAKTGKWKAQVLVGGVPVEKSADVNK